MRVRDGCEFKIFDGQSGEFWCFLEPEEGGGGRSRGTSNGVVTEQRRAFQPGDDVWLLVAALKSNMDVVTQKATELGVARVQVC
jgi:16S rRNA U1498 N3-methylase RsmE